MTGSPPAHSFAALAALMLIAGMGVPIMATLNAALGSQLQSPVAASTVLFGIGFALAATFLLVAGLPPRAAFVGAPWYLYGGAIFGAFYIVSITFSAPRMGVGNAVFFVLLGQLIAAAAIDHFGWFNALRSDFSWRRALGIVVMAFGVWLAKKPQ